MTIQQLKQTQSDFTGLLAGLMPGQLQTWGQLAMLPLLSASERTSGSRFVSPLEHLKLVRVSAYGSMILHNTAQHGLLIAPMHIGFFQPGAQNHATSRIIVLGKNETLTADDCFCIQASQGGYLKEAQQRFIILPLNLRTQALTLRGENSFSRLWDSIEQFNRRHGIKRGGHLERFLRPNFPRLVRFRHVLETVPEQVGAAYFVAGRLVGIEVAPDAACWQDVAPILTIYCYGAAALLAEQLNLQAPHEPVQLADITDLANLAQRLTEARGREQETHLQMVRERADASWDSALQAETQGLRIVTLSQDAWA
ncbi:MAG TPA: hypothetical protein VGN34_34065, partial [Ktedonobacteraceae bacterium]